MSTRDEVLARWGGDLARRRALERIGRRAVRDAAARRSRGQTVGANHHHVYALTGRTRYLQGVGWQREGRCAACGATSWAERA